MGDHSSIQWTDATWNPVVGCTKVSEGCRHCYAERLAPRLGQKFTDITIHTDRLETPFHWKKPRRVFVNSLSDLFHEEIPESFIEQVFGIMASAKQHTFQVLTKRPARMLEFMNERELYGRQYTVVHEGVWPPKNVWLGVSCEDQKTFQERWAILRKVPAAVRFLSLEPLLGPIDMQGEIWEDLGERVWPDWIIVGGESGHGARPCSLDWIRSIRDQCKSAGIACFVKQLGSKPHSIPDKISHRGSEIKKPDGFYRWLNDTKGGDMSEWPEDVRVREYPSLTPREGA